MAAWGPQTTRFAFLAGQSERKSSRAKALEMLWERSAAEAEELLKTPKAWIGWDEAVSFAARETALMEEWLSERADELATGLAHGFMELGEIAEAIGVEILSEIEQAGRYAALAGRMAARELRRERRALAACGAQAGRAAIASTRRIGWKLKALSGAMAIALSSGWLAHAQKPSQQEIATAAATPLGASSALSLAPEATPAAHWMGGAVPTGSFSTGLSATAPEGASAASIGGPLANPSASIGLKEPVDDQVAMQALSRRLAGEFKVDPESLSTWTTEASRQAKARGIEPTLALAVISVESRFQPNVRSGAGAVGLMQVMLRAHPDAVKAVGGARQASAPMGNIAVGMSVLDQVHQMSQKRGGGWPLALGYYNGSSSDRSQSYARKVLKEKARFDAMLKQAKEDIQYAQASSKA
jgi:soluble lytic murein transglycosylase-like protein